MKCPIRNQQYKRVDGQAQYEDEDCLKEECAWWVPAFECCSVWEIAIRLGSCADQLFNIKEILPEESKR